MVSTALGTFRSVCQMGDEYTLIQDSQDVRDTLESIGAPTDEHSLPGFLFVLVGDGEYLEVWAGDRYHRIPWNERLLMCLYQHGALYGSPTAA